MKECEESAWTASLLAGASVLAFGFTIYMFLIEKVGPALSLLGVSVVAACGAVIQTINAIRASR